MNRAKLAYIALIAVIILLALAVPSSSAIRRAPQKAQPTPEPTFTPEPTAQPTPEPTPIPTPETYIVLSKKYMNERLDAVAALQARLKQLGFYAGEVDGFYGESTFLAVVAFQRSNSMEVDGLAGESTQRLLFESDNVIDASGRVYVPFVEVTRAPTPTPSPTPRMLPLDEFKSGAEPNSALFGGTVYSDETISAKVQVGVEAVTVKVSVENAYQLRSALAGTYELPQHLMLKELAEKNRAVVAFAGTDYLAGRTGYEVRQQLALRSRLPGSGALMVIDIDGDVHLFSPTGAASALNEMEESVYQALSVPKSLIVNGIIQTGLSERHQKDRLYFGQTGALEYMLVYSGQSETEIARYMLESGCLNAALIGEGGIYTCFGDLTASTYVKQAEASNIIYFASHIQTEEE